MKQDLLLDVKGLKKYFDIRKGFFRKTVGYVKAVDGVDLFVRQGETLGLVGESGCGKTTTGRALLRLIPPTDGEIRFNSDFSGEVNVRELNKSEMNKLRQEAQIIFQDPFSSLNPRLSVERIVSEPLIIHQIGDRQSRRDRVKELLQVVGLSAQVMDRYPHEFSGGQRQRLGIARALALNPKFIVCDEPVSALDVSVQAQVLNLMQDLQKELGLTYLFIAHDLSVVEHISNRIGVMYLGRMIELTESEQLYDSPKHPYTEALLSAIPYADPDMEQEEILLEGNVPDPSNAPPGCSFHPRCRYAKDICKQEIPELVPVKGAKDHYVSCHRYQELELVPVKPSETLLQRVLEA